MEDIRQSEADREAGEVAKARIAKRARWKQAVVKLIAMWARSASVKTDSYSP